MKSNSDHVTGGSEKLSKPEPVIDTNDPIAGIEALIIRWWELRHQPMVTQRDQSRLFDCGIKLVDKLVFNERAFLALGQTGRAQKLVISLRGVVGDALSMRYFDRSVMYRQMLRSLLMISSELCLKLSFSGTWEFQHRIAGILVVLLNEKQLSAAGSLAMIVLDLASRQPMSRNQFKERFITTVLGSQLFWDISEYLNLIDPQIESHWKHEQRRNWITLRHSVSSKDGNFSIRSREVSYSLRDDAVFYFNLEMREPQRSVAIDAEICALKWCDEDVVWIVLDESAAIYIDSKAWTFTPDVRCFDESECATQDLQRLPQWVRERCRRTTSRF